MTLSAGSRIGPYQVLSSLGSGGMGEVYAAKDTRLAREVALKVLLDEVSADPTRVRRFEKEARSASALNHPNIVTIYDVGISESVCWIAMERVSGATLRQAISGKALPVSKALPIAVQIADGLAKAHEAGIVHRDLKPENVMLARDGQVKILDFGLAKLAPVGPTGGEDPKWPADTGTFPGVILGTVGYMSPEQAQGAPVDHRSDQFSFGSLLYEMCTGRRPFSGKTAIDTLAAIINVEPEPIERSEPGVPPPLRWVVERCLAKEPSRRYASTRDLAEDLRVLRDHLPEVSGASKPGTRAPRRLRFVVPLAAAALLAGLAAIFVASRRAGTVPLLDFQRLTFRRGDVSTARFAPDGRTVVYGARWDAESVRVFSTRTDGRDSARLDLPDADVASVSVAGEVAILLGRWAGPPRNWTGTLASVPFTGGAPRELIERASGADWSPDGRNLAVVRVVDGKNRLEFPIGKVLYETSNTLASPRFSPTGDRIAFLAARDGSALSNVSVEIVDLAGKHTVLSRGWKRGFSVAWSADGTEVWFNVNERGWRMPLYAVTLTGRMRLVTRLPSWMILEDVARDGRALVSLGAIQSRMRGMAPGDIRERELSWHDGSLAKDLTPDGKTLLFDEGGEGNFHAIYVRSTDGSPAKLIGDGRSMAISPDGRWVATNARERGSQVVLLPTGAGEPRVLDSGGHRFEEAAFFPDGRRLLVEGDRSCVIDLETGKLQPVAPEGTSCRVVSPDGKEVACTGPKDEGMIYPVEGGAPRPIPGFQSGRERLVRWSSDAQDVFVGQFGASPARIFRLNLATGRRELWRELSSEDPALVLPGVSDFFAMTPDGKSYAYSWVSLSSDLFLVTGLR